MIFNHIEGDKVAIVEDFTIVETISDGRCMYHAILIGLWEKILGETCPPYRDYASLFDVMIRWLKVYAYTVGSSIVHPLQVTIDGVNTAYKHVLITDQNYTAPDVLNKIENGDSPTFVPLRSLMKFASMYSKKSDAKERAKIINVLNSIRLFPAAFIDRKVYNDTWLCPKNSNYTMKHDYNIDFSQSAFNEYDGSSSFKLKGKEKNNLERTIYVDDAIDRDKQYNTKSFNEMCHRILARRSTVIETCVYGTSHDIVCINTMLRNNTKPKYLICEIVYRYDVGYVTSTKLINDKGLIVQERDLILILNNGSVHYQYARLKL